MAKRGQQADSIQRPCTLRNDAGGITVAQAEATIRAPGQVVPSVKGRDFYQSLIGRLGRLLLRVIVKEDENVYHVVTAYKTSQVKKYWSES